MQLIRVPDLEAVDSKTAPSFLIAVLQVRNNAVMYILLLLAQEVRGHSVQAVAGELVVPHDGPHDIELNTALNRDLLVVMRAVSLAAEARILHSQLAAAT